MTSPEPVPDGTVNDQPDPYLDPIAAEHASEYDPAPPEAVAATVAFFTEAGWITSHDPVPPGAVTAAAKIAYQAYAKQAEADYAATATNPAWPPAMEMRTWDTLPPNLQAAWEAAVRGMTPLIAAQAAAAERERIRQLAIETCASYYGVDQATGQSVLREFADLIGEERRLADGDGWDTARDRITEANQARADERERLRPLLDLLVKLARWSGHDLADLLSQAGCPDLLADLTGGDPS